MVERADPHRERLWRGPTVIIEQGDLCEVAVDAVVNAANSSLLGGGGVDGAIHRRGGPSILNACRELRSGPYAEGLQVGQAVATTAGALPARWVIHTVGPVWTASEDRSDLLASAHVNSLAVADVLGAVSVAFPAISTGAYGWPLASAASIALAAVASTPTTVEQVRFVLFSDEATQAFVQAARELGWPDSSR